MRENPKTHISTHTIRIRKECKNDECGSIHTAAYLFMIKNRKLMEWKIEIVYGIVQKRTESISALATASVCECS